MSDEFQLNSVIAIVIILALLKVSLLYITMKVLKKVATRWKNSDERCPTKGRHS